MDTETAELLLNSLNERGYLFQEACAETLLKHERSTGWGAPVLDYAVSLATGESAKVDIVRSRPEASGVEAYAIVECKRAHPEYVYWLFSEPDYGIPEEFHGVLLTPGLPKPKFHQAHIPMNAIVPLGWLEVRRRRSNQNQRASRPQTLEDAAYQALLGTAGVALEQVTQRSKEGGSRGHRVFFFPVIATTAKLIAARYNSKDIDITSGTIPRKAVSLTASGSSVTGG
jgi:hypothetical protein